MEPLTPPEFWQKLQHRFGRRRINVLAQLIIVGIAALTIRLVIFSGQHTSAILYLLIPYGISVLIAILRSYDPPVSLLSAYFSRLTTALVIFLATSVVLAEGFICVALFFPIYVFVVTLSFIARWLIHRNKNRHTNLYASVFPVLVVLLSLEGTTENLSFNRESLVEVQKLTKLPVEAVKTNLARPINLDKRRHWLLAIFAMPYEIEAGSLNEGDVHRIKTRYHRWFVTNTQEGEAELLIEHVGERSVRTRIINDTTYFSSYIDLHGTEIDLQPHDTGGTTITLRLHYRRKLDPAWYFHPLQQYTLEKMAEFLIQEVMIRD